MAQPINRYIIISRQLANKNYFRNWKLLLIAILGLTACGDEYWSDNVDCSTCYTPKPTTGTVSISVTINPENRKVPIKIFKGYYKEGFLKDYSSAIALDTVTSSKYQIDLDVNEYYSVAVEYTENGKKITVVDGDKLNIYHVSSACDQECWIIKGGNIDATLKK